MNKFTQALSNLTTTENGALTYKSSNSFLVDFFFQAAASRGNTDRVIKLFENAFTEDKEKALKLLFWLRDIRGGAGERNSFRSILSWLSQNETAWLTKNLHLIPEFGRFDDLFILFDTPCLEDTISFLKIQWQKDLESVETGQLQNLSLLGKWLPSENASSKQTKRYANVLISSGLFGTAKEYRKSLTLLRTSLNIVEQKISKKEYENIDYSKLPSYAALKYRKAFFRHDEARYKEYLGEVTAGTKEIKSTTLYPYDLTRVYGYSTWGPKPEIDPTVEAQWKALPDYVPEINGIVVYDTSGSMKSGDKPEPIDISVSLALYIAQRNKSEAWKNWVIPFSSKAELKKIQGDNLRDQISSIFTGDCSNTNLQSVFDLILFRGIKEGLTQEDMPKTLIIISDMEFDDIYSWGSAVKSTNFEEISRSYQNYGYERPKLIWWNVASRHDNIPCKITDKGNMLISGCSPSILKTVLSGEYDATEAMNATIESKRYSVIKY